MRQIRCSGKGIMNASLMAAGIWAVISGLNWPRRAGLFPTIVASVVLILASIELGYSLFEKEDAEDTDRIDFKLSTEVDQALANRRTLSTFLWLAGFLLVIILLGLPVAIPLFMFSYLKFESKESWFVSFSLTVVFWGCFYFLFIWLLKTQFPEGVLLSLMK
jgi:hypothetical protein